MQRATAGLLRVLALLGLSGLLVTSHSGGLSVLATGVVATGIGLLLLTVLTVTVVGHVRTAGSTAQTVRSTALRRRAWRTAFLPQRDPDARGRCRPRAPGTAPAAA